MSSRRLGQCVLALILGAATPVLASCSGDASDPSQSGSALSLAAQVAEGRRDDLLGIVQIHLQNRGPEAIVVDTLLVRMPGFHADQGTQVKEEPLPAGLAVNFPWPRGDVACGTDGEPPSVDRPAVTVRVHTETDAKVRLVRLRATDPDGLLKRIVDRTCVVELVRSEVDLHFGTKWRPENGPGGVIVHGTLQARLLIDQPRYVNETRGAIMYGLKPDPSAGPVGKRLAKLTPDHRHASIPVIGYASRCDPHVKAEIKKPYEFLVFISGPGRQDVAITPDINEQTKKALRLACAF